MKIYRSLIAGLLLVLACGGCDDQGSQVADRIGSLLDEGFAALGRAPGNQEENAQEETTSFGIDVNAIDRSIDPGQDFFRFANGRKKDRPSPFIEARERALGVLASTVSERSVLSRRGDGDTVSRLTLEQERAFGITENGSLATINAIASYEDLAIVFADPTIAPVAPFEIDRTKTNRDQPDAPFVTISQAGLGMKNRAKYFSPTSVGEREAYRLRIGRRLGQFLSSAKAVNDDSQDETDATLLAAIVLDLETKIATLHWTDEKSNSPTLSNRVLPVDGLESAVPSFPWAVYLGAAGPTNHRLEHIVLGQDTAVLEIARLVMETPLSSWQHYLRFHYLDSNRLTASHRPNAAHRLTANIEAADRSTLDALSALLSDRAKTDIGASIASPELRHVAEVIANDLKTAFREVVSESALLTPEQKSAALKRLGSLSVRIGSKPNDMLQSRIGVIGVDDLAMTSVDALHQSARYIPVDSSGRREAGTPPWDPDASYDPDDNTVYVSEALLTPMFLDPRIILAANYGRFGTIIGHEMVHAVDEFSAGVAPYASLSSTLFAEPYARIKALLEASDLGTNKIDTDGLSKMLLADAIGLNIAQRAWQKRTASSEDGIRSQSQQTDAWANPFDEQQRFFISWAQLWATPAQHSNTQQPMFRAEALRATIPLRLMDSWYRAFDISQGETIVLE